MFQYLKSFFVSSSEETEEFVVVPKIKTSTHKVQLEKNKKRINKRRKNEMCCACSRKQKIHRMVQCPDCQAWFCDEHKLESVEPETPLLDYVEPQIIQQCEYCNALKCTECAEFFCGDTLAKNCAWFCSRECGETAQRKGQIESNLHVVETRFT